MACSEARAPSAGVHDFNLENVCVQSLLPQWDHRVSSQLKCRYRVQLQRLQSLEASSADKTSYSVSSGLSLTLYHLPYAFQLFPSNV